MSDYLEAELRKHCFRTGSFTKPTNLYVALCVAATADSNTGATITEPTTGGYARAQNNPSDSNWTAASSTDGLTDNAVQLSWTNSAATVWNVSHVAICDAASGGNLLFHGPLDASKSIGQNDTFTFNVGQLNVVFS